MLLKIIIFLVVIVFIIRFFSRALLSMFIGNLNNKFTQAQNNHPNARNKEGDVIIKTHDKNDKKYGNEGEYVDFEEIKE